MPIGNGMLGALIWQKENKLRLSLDCADIWDERDAIDLSKFNYRFVQQHVATNDYDTVHQLGDWPYDNIAYPTKLPAGALQFDLNKLGKVQHVSLDIATALCKVDFEDGKRMNIYIHATDNVGYFGFEHFSMEAFNPELIIPNYNSANTKADNGSHSGEGLGVLGYSTGTVTKTINSIRYHQPTYKGHYYEIFVQWKAFPTTTSLANGPLPLIKSQSFPH